MTQDLAIVRQENIQTIVSATPQSYKDNALSREKCIEAGQALLDTIEAEGMTDELDQQTAIFIEKARKTVRKMNERRSPVTKLFDDIRKEFTAMENAIDINKEGTVPYKLQQLRNRYAAKKRAEEEERRRKEYERQQAEATRNKMKQDIEDDFKQQFQALVNNHCNHLSEIDNAVTLANYNDSLATLQQYSTNLPDDFLINMHTLIRIPAGITVDEIQQVENETKNRLAKQFAEQFNFEVDSTKQYILDRMPSKKANLERMAQASAEEAARIQAEMEERKRKEAAEQEAERKRKEEEEKQKAELARQQAEMDNLFTAQATLQEYQPKTKVTKKIEILNPDGFMPILSMWWTKEGRFLSVDELSKLFKNQITFCEKLANKEETFIEDGNICYIDDVKAK